jgi:hypothetical protein
MRRGRLQARPAAGFSGDQLADGGEAAFQQGNDQAAEVEGREAGDEVTCGTGSAWGVHTMNDSPPVYPFHLGVVAAPGFDVPDLLTQLRPRLRSLLGRRMTRREPLAVTCVCGEPISAAMKELSAEKGWNYSFVVRHPDRGSLGYRAACGQLAAMVDGLLLVQRVGEESAELDALAKWAEWLGVKVRAVEV